MNNEMTVKELREAKEKLAEDIQKLLIEFTEKSGVVVEVHSMEQYIGLISETLYHIDVEVVRL